MLEFFQTVMGHRYYEHDVPELIKQLKRIADALEIANKIKQEEQTKVDKEKKS